MQKSISGKLFSAPDLVNFAACAHLTHLDLISLERPLTKAVDTDEMALIQCKDFEHEGRYLQLLKTQCGGVTALAQEGISDEAAFANTCKALASGAAVLFQAMFLTRPVLPEGARVSTVNKFQGQEAEAVMLFMTTSSGEYLPRNIEFLYSKNRLNVAVSRARCLAVVVASPRLLDVDCKSPEQMVLVNTLCWIKDYSWQ